MAIIFRKDDVSRTAGEMYLPNEEKKGRSLLQDAHYILTMILILIFAAQAVKDAVAEAGVDATEA
jgi:hypothetical protein